MQIIGGFLRGRHLFCPKGLEIRPTSSMLREMLFNIIQHKIADARFLDLFAGTGAMGIEAISRGAKEVVFIDNNKKALLAIEKNLELLQVTSLAKVYLGDALGMIKKPFLQEIPFDLIYIDPPYDFFDDSSFLPSLLKEIQDQKILKKGGLLFVEAPYRKKDPIPESAFDGFSLERRKRVGHSELIILNHF